MTSSKDVLGLSLSLIILLVCACQRNNEPLPRQQEQVPPTASQTAQGELPGAEPFGAALKKRLQAALAPRARDEPDSSPRTRHLTATGEPKYVNRLLLETSPYLRQHAHNPVNWYPWGNEAFETAVRLNRPILLSVGYSTCHWCHVMEEESFEDEEIAAYLNRHYIAIKVDREQRPDVDSLYMSAVQLMVGRGGWPMTVWLTPTREPFYGGTYFPPRAGDRGSQRGFLDLLQLLHERYQNDPDGIARASAQLVAALRQQQTPPAGNRFSRADAADVLLAAADAYRNRFDADHGGVQGSPKFPSAMPVRVLLRHYRRSRERTFLDMATSTLEHMARGGIYDHVGGGFHRYATDAAWQIPHFEKMLYDQALLTSAYLEAYQVSGQPQFADVARDVLAYVAREMTAPGGGFYSATDADSQNQAGHREEGAFFTWTPAEIDAALGPAQAQTAKERYAVTANGNFEGRTVLHLRQPWNAQPKGSIAAGQARDRAIRQTLRNVRAERPAPLRDDKVLTAWNGLMISAFARAAMVLGENDTAAKTSLEADIDYLAIAVRAADFVLNELRQDGRLLRSHHLGQSEIPGFLDDYTHFIAALLDLFEASGQPRWLREARALDRVVAERFEDRESGAFFATSNEHEQLLTREKPSHDGALPSGNSMAALNLLRLYELTLEQTYLNRVESLFEALAPVILGNPTRMSEMLLALDFWTDTPKAIILVGPGDRDTLRPLTQVLARSFVPNAVTVRTSDAEVTGATFATGALANIPPLTKEVPLVENKRSRRGAATAYVCEHGRCELPTSDPVVFGRQIAKIAVE